MISRLQSLCACSLLQGYYRLESQWEFSITLLYARTRNSAFCPQTCPAVLWPSPDVPPDSTQYAVGHLDGSVYIYPSQSKPHPSAVSSLRFFPSFRVLLTAGIDFTLKILPADLPAETATATATPAATRITPLAYTSYNRNRDHLSRKKHPFPLDSTVKLRDVRQHRPFSQDPPIQSMAVTDDTILCGLQSGQFQQ